MAVLATMVTLLLLYLLVIVWARRADLRNCDTQKGLLVVGKSWNPYSYEITIATSKGRNSGTTANVALVIVGENGSSGVLPLSKLIKVAFRRASVITCTALFPSWLGQLLYVHIWHDNSGDSPAWSLDHVLIRDTLSNEKWNFICGEWLAVESEEGKTDKVLYVADPDEITNYKSLFLSKSADGLFDEHIWISVAAKPPQSSFTCVQRASCCLSVLFCTMIANAMFYDDGKIDTSPVFFLGPLKISVRQLMIGIQSSMIIFPVNLAMTQLFRKTSSASIVPTEEETTERKPKKPLPKTKPNPFIRRFVRRNSSLKYITMDLKGSTCSLSTISPDCSKTHSPGVDYPSVTKNDLNLEWKIDSEKIEKNRKRYFNSFLYYTAWVLTFASVSVSAFFTLLYSLQWGKEKSDQWLLSFFVSFVQDAAISQPVKVAMFSAMIAFFIKFTMGYREKHNRFITKKTGIKDRRKENYFSQMFDSDDSADESQPLQQKALQKAKLKRMKEVKSSQVMSDVLLYSVFLLLLLLVAYGHRDPIAYVMTKNLENQFSLSGQTYLGVWSWALYSFIPTIFVGPWYNGRVPSKFEDGMISDRSSALVGMARIRQLRVKSDSCSYDTPLISYLSNGCYRLYTMHDEDTSIYQPGWVAVPPNIPAENISYEICPKPWRYHSATDLNGVPMWGTTTIYSGGGYVAELGYHTAKAQEVIKELIIHGWIDRRSRGVFVELTVYNAQVNLFSVISLLAELMPTGGVVTFRRIDTVRVYRYQGELGNVVLAAELIIGLVILFFMYKIIKCLYYQKLAFFMKFWNLVDLFQVLFALVSITLYFVKMVNINETMKDLSENPFAFVSFSLLLTWSEIDTYMIAFVVFLTTIKFLYLLRYNKHVKLLNQTFSNMRKEILLFVLQFMFWFLPFVLLAHITFGAHLEDFISLPSAFQAMLNALLGASYFHDLEQADRVIGPVLFFTYSLLMELILINMFVAIINAAFADRESPMKDAETDPELIEFIMKRLKNILGVNMLMNSIGPQKHEKWFVDDSSDEENERRRDNRQNSLKSAFTTLNKKMSSIQGRLRKVSVIEEDEELLLEMMVVRKRQLSNSPRSEASDTTHSSL